MRISIDNRVTFKKSQPTGGVLRGVKKDLVSKTPPYFTKDLAYLTLKYKN